MGKRLLAIFGLVAALGLGTPALINDAFVMFAVGLFATQRAEMALRARRLKQQHAALGGAVEPR